MNNQPFKQKNYELVPLVSLPAPIAVTGRRTLQEPLLIADQHGQIYQMDLTTNTIQLYWDLSKLIPTLKSDYDERGLLDITLVPGTDYRLILFMTNLQGQNQLAELDLLSGQLIPLLIFDFEATFHNGGKMAWGPDKYLYLGIGDGGPQRDPNNHAQNLSSPRGKLLRLDLSLPGKVQIPPDNPFRNVPEARPEIYAYGLRNPWGISFDSSGQGCLADVGYQSQEELNLILKGANYGWNYFEGSIKTEWNTLPPNLNLTFPVFEYPTGKFQNLTLDSSAIIGGYFLSDGTYLGGDFGGILFRLDSHFRLQEWVQIKDYIRAFGQDGLGEIYVLTSSSSGPSGGIVSGLKILE